MGSEFDRPSREERVQSWLTTPRAIIVGAFVIGAFAYLGLLQRGAQVPPAPPASALVAPIAPATTSSGAAQPPPTLPTVAPLATVPPPKSVAEAAAAATKALQPHVSALRTACWVGRPPEARAKLTLNFSFDARGQQIVRGVSEPRLDGAQRAWVQGLGACVQQKLPPLSIDPPGASVQVEIPIDFP